MLFEEGGKGGREIGSSTRPSIASFNHVGAEPKPGGHRKRIPRAFRMRKRGE